MAFQILHDVLSDVSVDETRHYSFHPETFIYEINLQKLSMMIGHKGVAKK